jgi:hypothetical protein
VFSVIDSTAHILNLLAKQKKKKRNKDKKKKQSWNFAVSQPHRAIPLRALERTAPTQVASRFNRSAPTAMFPWRQHDDSRSHSLASPPPPDPPLLASRFNRSEPTAMFPWRQHDDSRSHSFLAPSPNQPLSELGLLFWAPW